MVKELTDNTFDEQTDSGLTLVDFLGNLVWALSYAISSN